MSGRMSGHNSAEIRQREQTLATRGASATAVLTSRPIAPVACMELAMPSPASRPPVKPATERRAAAAASSGYGCKPAARLTRSASLLMTQSGHLPAHRVARAQSHTLKPFAGPRASNRAQCFHMHRTIKPRRLISSGFRKSIELIRCQSRIFSTSATSHFHSWVVANTSMLPFVVTVPPPWRAW